MSGSDDLRVFCAIDTRDIDVAVSIADEVREHVRGVKLGLEFFGTYGPNGVRRFLDAGLSVFLDLKFFDIPNTVSGAVQADERLSVCFLKSEAVLPQPYSNEEVATEPAELTTLKHNSQLLRPTRR
jgi:orotidine-5'-phosphate decarboxylase